MYGVLAFLMLALALPASAGQRSSPSECIGSEPAVTVQIHIYSHVPSDALERASDVVTRVYDKVGVKTVWLGVVRQGKLRTQVSEGPEPARVPIAQITIIFLTPEMAARGQIPADVLGYAAVASEGMGRIAYVVYDRVRKVAAEADSDEGDLLGYVIAHEMGHLFLGRGSQAEDGVMKGRWDRRALQQVNPLELRFTAAEAGRIRRVVADNSTTLGAVATTGRSTGDTCIVPRDDDHVAQEPR